MRARTQDAQTLAASTPSVGATLAAALEARAHALVGRAVETRAALNRAEHTLSRLAGDDLAPSAFGYNEAQLRFHESNALTHLGDTKGAWAAQERALLLAAHYDYTDRSLTQLDRATCLLREGDFSGAAAHAVHVLDLLTQEQRRGIITNRAREILDALPAAGRDLAAGRNLREIVLDTRER